MLISCLSVQNPAWRLCISLFCFFAVFYGIIKTVAALLLDWNKEQDFIKEALSSEYQDYNLVMAGPVGFPIESSAIEVSFNRLIEENGLPIITWLQSTILEKLFFCLFRLF